MRTITEDQKAKLIAINELVKNEEVKAIARYEILQKKLKRILERKSIWDYNLDIRLSCFASDKALNKKYNTEEGDPIFEWGGAIYELYITRKENPSWSALDYIRGTILEGFQFCSMFYCILNYSDLSIEEILLIQAIWIELPVDYQWEVELIEIAG